jgi:hypothetical protein
LLYRRNINYWIFIMLKRIWDLDLFFKYFFIWKIVKRRLLINLCIYSFFAFAHDLFYIQLFFRLFIFILLKDSNPRFFIHHFKKLFSIIHESLNLSFFRSLFSIKFFRFTIWAIHDSAHESFRTLSLFQFIFISILFHYKLLFF